MEGSELQEVYSLELFWQRLVMQQELIISRGTIK